MRINVDEKFFGDPRTHLFEALTSRKIKEIEANRTESKRTLQKDTEWFKFEVKREKAIAWGYALMIWRESYSKCTDLVNSHEIDDLVSIDGFSEVLIASGLAEIIDGKIRIRGAKERYRYIEKQREIGKLGGIASGEKRNNKKSKSNRIEPNRTESKRTLQKSKPDEASEPSLLLTPCSDSDSDSDSNSVNKQLSKAPSKLGAQVKDVIGHYCSEYKQRYGINPMIGKKEAGIIKRLLSECSQERLAVLISAYVKMPDAWFITRGHDLPTFSTNLNKVTLFAEKGRILTSEDARTIEAQAHHSAVVADVIKMRELEREEERKRNENGN